MDIKTVVILGCILSVFKTVALDCKDENNNPVDWFIVYKIPKQQNSDTIIEEGCGYIYLTSDDTESWIQSKVSIEDENSIIGNTLKDFYQDKTDLTYILYNDEPPNQATNGYLGHTKGAVVADTKGGFWLIHSVPKFPDEGNTYSYPDTAKKYAQSFICISMDLDNIDKVGLQLQYNQPYIYSSQVLVNMESKVPELVKAANNETIKSAPWSNVARIYSKNDVTFTSFAKHAECNQELYVDIVAPRLKSDLDVETWPNGAGRLTSNCTEDYNVYNIESINLPIDNMDFKSTSDHSKWAVSTTASEKYWICIGDINRAEHQAVRGGGTICMTNKKISGYFKKLIGSVETCSKYDDLPFVLRI